MKLFLDTSAMVKLFHKENGTDVVEKLSTSEENEIWILELARLKFLSALFRRYRNNEIDEETLGSAISKFEDTFNSFNIEPLGKSVLNEADFLMKRYGKDYGLRTLDALQIGAFNLISDEDCHFVCSDNNLCKIVEMIGYKIINPLEK